MGYQTKIPSCVYAGVGNIEEVGTILKQEPSKKTLVSTDKGAVGAGLSGKLTAVLERTGVEYRVSDGLSPEPAYTDMEKVVEQMNRENGDVITVIGGGSVMNAAELCSLLKSSPCTVTDLLTDPLLASEQMKTVMIPITCGAGSEATCNAIVTIPKGQSKKGTVNAEVMPGYVILDTQMVTGLPAFIVTIAGTDALAHIVEYFTSKKTIPLDDTYAAAGARLIFRNIKRVYRNPGNMEARSNMMLGVFYGGVVITGSGATVARALSYPLGGKYHIPHGVSNTILFAHVMAFSKDTCAGRLRVFCNVVYPERATLGTEEEADYMIEWTAAIVENTETPIYLNTFGVRMAGLDLLVDAGSK